MRRLWPTAVLAAMLLLTGASRAQAAAVLCPGTPATTDREFTIDTAIDATCLGAGVGDITGVNDEINNLGFTTLNTSDDSTNGVLPNGLVITGVNGLFGTFSISAAAAAYGPLVIAFKSENAELDPDWVAFLLPDGVLAGNWSIAGRQGLVHANIYGLGDGGGNNNGGEETPVPPTATPEPLSAVLLGSGLLTTAMRKRVTHSRS